MLISIGRILAGYVLACVAFGVVLAAFVFTPAEIVASEAAAGRLSMAGTQALLSATQVAIFAAPLAVVAAIVAEWCRISAWLYYAVVGIVIAILGFLAQYASELQGQPTIVNNYALTAFLTGGLVSGLVYWIVAGRRAASRGAIVPAPAGAAASNPTAGQA